MTEADRVHARMDEHTSGEIKKIREETAATVRRDAYFWLIMVLTAVMAAGASIAVSTVNTRRSERKLCAIVITTDDTYHENAPTTEPGRKQAQNFARLRAELGCPAR